MSQITYDISNGDIGVVFFSKELSLEIAMDLTVKLLNALTDSHPDLSEDDKCKIETAASVVKTHRNAGG
ncbi:MAG: hypothetical protein COS76_01220 [Candidatus Portnoybacteria bacterium CG06_land_8_20_14_3_00_39_12]|uniref:Uncharacterized protein n=1 Tax=Candidatus Portnoybacteria bacterium CG06_land_8_20_14_3_00_39_12 TaxID=1974809 RepID=A0A2M7AXJ2_9BACT|nr:MAG: hypothetical protein COS76_01220 [Candidatus Portnoybacteria bacterium CG06_land_8_20_14_3_00_39_12]